MTPRWGFFWVIYLSKICFEEKENWPEDLSPAKENVTSSGKDLLSLTKQMNDPLVVYYRKESEKVFNRDMKILFREIFIMTF